MVQIAWSTPLTAVAGAALTFGQWNASVRDNLLETAPAKATTAGRHFAVAGTNSIVERAIQFNSTALSQDTASATFTDLGTIGPTVSPTLTSRAIVFLYCSCLNSTAGAASLMGYEVSGASSISAADSFSLALRDTLAQRASAVFFHTTGLTAGTNTFTAKYRVTAGTGTWDDRKISVFPF